MADEINMEAELLLGLPKQSLDVGDLPEETAVVVEVLLTPVPVLCSPSLFNPSLCGVPITLCPPGAAFGISIVLDLSSSFSSLPAFLLLDCD